MTLGYLIFQLSSVEMHIPLFSLYSLFVGTCNT